VATRPDSNDQHRSTLLGELGLYMGVPRTASVVALEPSTVYCLSQASLQEMEQQDADLANAFHRSVARLIAERFIRTERGLQALQAWSARSTPRGRQDVASNPQLTVPGLGTSCYFLRNIGRNG